VTDNDSKSFMDNPTLYEGTYLEFLGFRLATWKDGFARIELIRATSSLFFAQAKLFDPDNNRLCATATATYKQKARKS